MPHERELSRDRDLVLKHQHSFSESISSRSSLTIPMWDSSDPERAPPPLPLNPGAGTPVTKANTSANVAAAAEAIAARVRESQYTPNTSPTKSPEKSLIKDHHHKRLQSMSNGAVKDLSAYLGNGKSDRSPERSPERSRSSFSLDRPENKTPTRPESRSETPPPVARDLSKDMPSLRPSSRQPLKAILGEDSPQSATMKALQAKESDERDISSSSSRRDAMALVRTPQSIDAISSQILSLTTIATNLQQEMAQLSRRSRDNATDLISLKEATNSRDEDIRKTLRELVVNLNTKKDEEKRALPRPNSFFIDEKPHFSPSTPKNISLPRIPSPASFAASIDRELIGSPTPYSTDGAAAIALLEKILREMGTKEGQEHITLAITELASKGSIQTASSSPDVTKKLEEILRMLRENSESKAIVRVSDTQVRSPSKIPESPYDYSLHPAVALARAGRNVSMGNMPISGGDKDIKTSGSSAIINEDMAKLIKRIKDSVTESGGLTNEVKALVRELRGEVLGMGREIGRKLEAVEKTNKSVSDGSSREQMTSIVEEGLAQLKRHMDEVMRERRRQSSSSIASKNTIDTQEVHAAIQSAVRELHSDKNPGMQREDILDAVREAWETYKPEIEIKNDGLAPEEILECLEKGLQDYRSQSSGSSKGATYEDVLDAVKQGLDGFQAPKLDSELTLTREEIISTMRECMESLELSSRSGVSDYQKDDIMDAVKEALLLHAAALSRDSTVSREDLLDAVRDGFINHEPAIKEIEINRDDLFEAVRAGLQEAPTNDVNEQVLIKMQDLIDVTREEFQQYSAANGKDTEQVLDAMKDGLDSLRRNIETYVDRAADVTGKDEIIETVKDAMESLRADLETSISSARGPAPTTSSELLDVMEKEFEHLRNTLTSSVGRGEGPAGGREELLDALREGFDELKATRGISNNSSNVEDELRHLRETLASTMTRSAAGLDREDILDAVREGIDRMDLETKASRPESILSGTGELLDAFHEGLDKLKIDIEHIVSRESIEGMRSDIERVVNEVNRPIDMTINYEILDLLKDGLAKVQADVAKLARQHDGTTSRGGEVIMAEDDASRSLSRPDIANIEVMIGQLKTKVDSLDNPPAPADLAVRPEFDNLENMVKNLQDTVGNMATKDETVKAAATKDDIQALETILLNSKAKLDDLSMPNADDLAKAAQFEALETMMKDLSHALDDLTLRQEDNLPSKTDFNGLESLVKGLQTSVEELRTKISDDNTSQEAIEGLQALAVETQNQLKEILPEGEKAATNSAMLDVQTLVKDLHEQTQAFQEKMVAEAELTAQAFESRKIEHGGLADKIEDVKAFLESIRAELKSQINIGGEGMEGLASTLTTLGEALTAANAVESLKEMKELIESKVGEISEAHAAGLETHREVFMEKSDEHKNAILDELTAKLDTHFGEMMSKYDDAQISSTERSTSLENKTRDGIDAMLSTKTIADELKILVDTLGHTVTESCNNMAEDSKTVFTKVDELAVKQDLGFSNLVSDLKQDNQLTRVDVARGSSTIDTVYKLVSEHNPKVMEAIQDVLNVMSQHFEMAQKSTEEIKSSVREIPGSIPLPALPAPVSSPTEEQPFFSEKYDDSKVHTKLDKLVELAAESGKSNAQFDILQDIKSQVAATASDFDAFVKSQLALTAEREESRQKEVEEAGIALEKRVAQQQAVEAEIVTLSDEKNKLHDDVAELKESVDLLKQEEKQMLALKAKLQAELSSLETALQIRKEEMHVMESRAEKLERRIIEGVMDQSRSVLLGSRPPSSLNVMNLKRVPSATSQATARTSTTMSRSMPNGTSNKSSAAPAAAVLGSAVSKALKRRQPPSATASPAGSLRSDRRILSLSTISGNKGSSRDGLGLIDPATAAKSKVNAGFGALKRSHSVKSAMPSRNTSWGGSKQVVTKLDKENTVLEEEEESSDTDTGRRSSYADTFDDTASFITGSVVGSRQPSYALSSVVGTVDESDREDDPSPINTSGPLQICTGIQSQDFVDEEKRMVIYGKDSGIGSEPPTATLETDGNFFGN